MKRLMGVLLGILLLFVFAFSIPAQAQEMKKSAGPVEGFGVNKKFYDANSKSYLEHRDQDNQKRRIFVEPPHGMYTQGGLNNRWIPYSNGYIRYGRW